MQLVQCFANFAERPIKHIDFTRTGIIHILLPHTLRSNLPYNEPINVTHGLMKFHGS